MSKAEAAKEKKINLHKRFRTPRILFLTVGIILQFDKELKKERPVLQVHFLHCRLQNPVSTAPATCKGIACLQLLFRQRAYLHIGHAHQLPTELVISCILSSWCKFGYHSLEPLGNSHRFQWGRNLLTAAAGGCLHLWNG